MLVLSRKQNERILIGDKVVVTIVRIGNGSVRLGIDAPTELTILREEVADLIAAAQAGSTPHELTHPK